MTVRFLLLTLPTLGLLVIAGCAGRGRQSAAPVPTPASKVSLAKAQFVGDAECAGCHPTEVAKQARTAHAATLHTMDREHLGPLAPPLGPVRNSEIVLVGLSNGRYGLTVSGEKADPTEIHFAVGSGKTGMTHVIVLHDNQLLELSRSYFPARHRWYTTPGHEKHKKGQIGMVYDPQQARHCFLCHAVTVPENAVAPNPLFYGVGCEACHGPASVHLEAAKSGQPVAGTMEKVGEWQSERINNLCGLCHRTQQNVRMATSQVDMTNRFQAYGLMRSRCFNESGGRISCITCHDPHANTSHDRTTYESACLKCHSSAAPASAGSGKPCPVDPRAGCIPCHMPSRPVFKNTDIPTSMADHLIAVHKPSRAAE